MVCSIGSGRMTVMARLLSAGSLSQNISEEVGQQKLAYQYLYKELHEADEPNLLDEEDMHVFGFKPMSDPLHLVCCNACKKPVKASQYAAHSELCRSLNSSKEMQLEANGAVGCRKPPRKEKKRSLSAQTNHVMVHVDQQRSECMDAFVSQLDGQPSMPSTSLDGKGISSMMDGKGASHENTPYPHCVKAPPAKRLKIVSRQHSLQADDSETASGITKVTSTQDQFTCRDYQPQPAPGIGMSNDNDVSFKSQEEVHNCSLLSKCIAVPLATKIYYSQKNNHLRAAFAHFYHLTSVIRPSNNAVNSSPESSMQLWTSQRDYLCELADDLQKEREPSERELAMNLVQSSEVCLDKSEGCFPAPSNQSPHDNVLRPRIKRKYLAKSFVDSSGRSLGTVQQPNGSVPVT